MAPARIALVASALAVVSAQTPVPVPMTTCGSFITDFSGQNQLATYDFTAAFNASSDYNWQDRNDLYVKNNTYIFQVRGYAPNGGRWASAPPPHLRVGSVSPTTPLAGGNGAFCALPL